MLSLVARAVDRELIHTIGSMILPQTCSVRVSATCSVHSGILLLALVVVGTDVVSEVESELLGDPCAVVVVLEYGSTKVIVRLFLSLASATSTLTG